MHNTHTAVHVPRIRGGGRRAGGIGNRGTIRDNYAIFLRLKYTKHLRHTCKASAILSFSQVVASTELQVPPPDSPARLYSVTRERKISPIAG